MKKILLIFVLFFNLIPVLKKGMLTISGPQGAYAQTQDPGTEKKYDDPCDGLQAACDQSFGTLDADYTDIKEESGFIGTDPDGNRVFIANDDSANSTGESDPHADQYNVLPGGVVTREVDGVTYNVESVVHTHPTYYSDPRLMGPSTTDGDFIKGLNASGGNITGVAMGVDGSAHIYNHTDSGWTFQTQNLDDFIDGNCN